MIGRAAGSTLRLDDPSVSRVHARISRRGAARARGSRTPARATGRSSTASGVDGPLPLRDGARIRLGDQELTVERRRDTAEAGRTIVVRPGARSWSSAVTPAGVVGQATQIGLRPRVRAGYALKRLDASEGSAAGSCATSSATASCGWSDNDAQLFRLLDGSRSLAELVGEAERRFGPTGPARLVRLLADLGERGLHVGRRRRRSARAEAPASVLAAAAHAAREDPPGSGRCFDALYRRGGWVLFTRPALWLIGGAVRRGRRRVRGADRAALRDAVRRREQVGIGGLVFLLGRFLVVAVHELAHGLAMASYGRRVDRAGLKLVGDLPVRVRRHVRGVVRAARDGGSRSARRGRCRTSRSARRSRSACLLLPDGDDPRHLLPGRVRRLRRRVLQPQPVPRARRLPHARRLAARAGAAAARARAVRAPAVGRRAQRRLARARALLALGARVDGARGRHRGRAVAALPAGRWRRVAPDWIVLTVLATLWVASSSRR